MHPEGVLSARPPSPPTPGDSDTPRSPECGASLRRDVGAGWGEASGAASPRSGSPLSTDKRSGLIHTWECTGWGGGCVEHPRACGGAWRGGLSEGLGSEP